MIELVDPFPRSVTDLVSVLSRKTGLLTHPPTHRLIHLLSHLPTHSPTHSLTHPLTHPLTYSLTVAICTEETNDMLDLWQGKNVETVRYSLGLLCLFCNANKDKCWGNSHPCAFLTRLLAIHRRVALSIYQCINDACVGLQKLGSVWHCIP